MHVEPEACVAQTCSGLGLATDGDHQGDLFLLEKQPLSFLTVEEKGYSGPFVPGLSCLHCLELALA